MQVNKKRSMCKNKKTTTFFLFEREPLESYKMRERTHCFKGVVTDKAEALPSFRERERARVANQEGV